MDPPTYTLYHNLFSVCSIMVRYTMALRGSPRDSESDIHIQECAVDLFHKEQLSEDFLCNINAKGQVPVLVSPALSKPIADSLEITEYLSTIYPSLIPESHKKDILKWLRDLHSLNYFSLSFSDRPYVAQGFKAAVEERLKEDLSERYRQALNYKLEILNRDKIGGVQPGVPEIMNERAKDLLLGFQSLLPEHGFTNKESGPWLFGLKHPTALDAHLIVFIARMLDIGRSNIIPMSLGKYAARAMEEDEWEYTMQGRKTMVAG